jgi:hypothetical protein
VEAFWDEEAHVWVASSDDVPGLVTEADTMDKISAASLGTVGRVVLRMVNRLAAAP